MFPSLPVLMVSWAHTCQNLSNCTLYIKCTLMKLLKCLSGMTEKLLQNVINPNLKHVTTGKAGRRGSKQESAP